MPILNRRLFENRKNRYIAVITFILFLLIFWRIFSNIQDNKKRASRVSGGQVVVVQHELVRRGTIIPLLKFSGSLEPIWHADISSKVAGHIERVLVYEGDIVEQGQILVILDGVELRAQAEQAKGVVYESRSNLEQTQLNLSRTEKLFAAGAVSQQTLDTARFARDMAIGKLESSTGNYDALKSRADSTRITAPRNGIIARKYIQDGEFAPVSAPIINLADTSKLLAKISVGEAEITNISLGQEAILKVVAYGEREFKGKITRISPVAALPSRVFNAEITVDNANNDLKGGMFASSFIVGKRMQNVLLVPQAAVVMREDQKTVYIVNKDGIVERRLIQTGYTGNGQIEIVSGLAEGETIITDGQNRIREGVKVKLAESTTGGK